MYVGLRHTSCLLQVPTLNVFKRLVSYSPKAPKDNEITAQLIKFVDETGKFQGTKPSSQVLRSYDRQTHTLINLTPKISPPTCRLYSKIEIKEMQKKLHDQKRAKKSNPGAVTKQVTFGWNVGQHDVEHKMEGAIIALQKGNKLEVLFGVRKKRSKAADAQRRQLIENIEKMCSSNAKESRPRTGSLATELTMFWQGIAISPERKAAIADDEQEEAP